MNDLVKNNIKNYINPLKKRKIKIGFLDEFGAGITGKDKIIKNLISTCEEGIDYSKIYVTS